MERPKPNNAKSPVAKPAASPAKPAATTTVAKPVPVKVAPLFRPIDWLALIITFLTIWGIYLYTLAPELTLEDSGELCTGSFYAGIPHPPGYPFWAIYSWLWTVILPMGNVAWRVEVGESFAAAMGCGLVALMVSRGSSMLIEGIEELKSVTNRWEKAIGLIAGCVTGMLVGLDAYMWSESVVINRISLFGVPWLTVVLVLLLRWIYAPQQQRYLYLGMFVYGICATIHQSLLLSAMGIEVAIACANSRLGRDLFLTNSIIYLICLMLKGIVPALSNMSSLENLIFHAVGLSSIAAGAWLSLKTEGIGSEWKTILIMGLVWTAGVCFYFYEPLAGMTVPPMQWGYPRTVEGFFHALSRGQYESVHGTDIFDHPVQFFVRFIRQLGYIANGLAESYSLVYIFIGLLPFLFIFKMQKRERAWILGLTAIYFCLSVLMVIMLDVTPDRSATELNKVFFTASHTLFAIMIGYGLTLMAAYVATHYQKFRLWGLVGGGVAVILALLCLKDATGKLYFGMDGDVSLSDMPKYIVQAFGKYQYGSPVYANLILLAMTIVFVLAMLVYRNRGPVLILLALFTVMPVYSGLAHWYKSEQRDHWFGYWFGHDMFTPPFGIYPQMTRDAILFGGTDPGRFCPTYMIFCESFIPHKDQPLEDQKFDRRDVYIITQNALADGTYLQYIRSEYFRSAEKDPPFFSELFKYVVGLPFPSSGDSGLVQGIANTLYYTLDVPFTKFGANLEKRRRAEGVYPPKEIYTPSPDDLNDCFRDYTDDVQRRRDLGQLKAGEDLKVDAAGHVQVSGQVAVMMINGLLCKVIFDHNPTNEFFVEESFPLDWMYPYETPFGVIMKINRDPLAELPPDVFKKDHDFWSKYSERLIGNWITYDTTVKQIADFAEKLYIKNNYEGFKGDPRFIRDDDGQKAFSKLRSSIAGIYAWRCFPKAPGRPDGCPPEYLQKTAAGQEALIKETDFAFKQAFAFCPYSPEAVYRYVNFLLQLNRLEDALIVAETCQKLDPFNDSIVGLVNQLKGFRQDSTQRSQGMIQLQAMETMAQTNPGNLPNVLSLASAYMQMQNTGRAVELFNQALNNPTISLPYVAQIVQYVSEMQNLPKLDAARVDKLCETAMNSATISASDTAEIAQIYSLLANMPKLEAALQKLVALQPNVPEPRYDLARLEATLGQTDPALKDLQSALEMSKERLKTSPKSRDLLVEARKDRTLDGLRNLPAFQKLVPAN
jgi:tetratricopeptide (TPR) repeat protein